MKKYNIFTKLVGVSFKNNDNTDRQELIKKLKEDDILTIEHEPNNPYDSNSHVIISKYGVLGHISRSLALDIINKQKEGQKIIGIKDFKVTGQQKHTLGVNITIEMEKS